MEAVATKVVGGVVADSVSAKVKKEMGYIWSSKDILDILRNEVDKLKDMKNRVEQKMKLAIDNGDELVACVHKWVDAADAYISETREFLQEEADANKTCFNLRMCVNPVTLRRYGKHAAKQLPLLQQHQQHGATFEANICIPTAPPGILELFPRVNIDDLSTHNSLVQRIVESVLDEDIQITGLYGIGGAGKTTLATEVAERVKDIFSLVFVTLPSSVTLDRALSFFRNSLACKRNKLAIYQTTDHSY